MRGLSFIVDIHLYSEHLYRFIAEVRMCDCLDFISVIRDVNSAAGIVALRISLCDNQAVILAEHNSLIPVVITQAILFRFLSANHGIEVFTFNGKLQVSHDLPPLACEFVSSCRFEW
ncbi:hypothetical protein ECRS218_0062 [Enterobacteria phage CUS-3]|uniref:Uncharacterized protein n=1 Tax=Escherichia coli (strain UTI89 / UPEC) TaxID=364106 RepID=Q1R907_ECOUT|nr:hypothetical protein UTI89_C2691 [Escherichia coli UTI89]ABQ88442.1 hypothetical protein ECRS218_0062 [Enterobacteria phage CUS-3]